MDASGGAVERHTRPWAEGASERMLNVREVAKAFGVHENTVRKWADNGTLPCERLPGSGFRRFHRADVERLVAAGRP